MSLAPEIVKQLADQKAAGLPQVWEAPVAVIRELTQGRVAFAGVPESILSVTNRFIPGPTADLPIRIYRPNQDQNAPAMVFFHGGGWVLNFLDIYDAVYATDTYLGAATGNDSLCTLKRKTGSPNEISVSPNLVITPVSSCNR